MTRNERWRRYHFCASLNFPRPHPMHTKPYKAFKQLQIYLDRHLPSELAQEGLSQTGIKLVFSWSHYQEMIKWILPYEDQFKVQHKFQKCSCKYERLALSPYPSSMVWYMPSNRANWPVDDAGNFTGKNGSIRQGHMHERDKSWKSIEVLTDSGVKKCF